MPYSVEIRKVLKSGSTYSHEAVNYDGTNALMPDEVIRSVRIDDASVDPADLFATIGRKCKITTTAYNNSGWLSASQSDDLSHPDYSDWYPYVFIVRREREDSLNSVIFIGALKKTNYSIDRANSSETFYLSDAVDIWIDIEKSQPRVPYYNENLVTTQDLTGLFSMAKWTSLLSYGSASGQVNPSYELSDVIITNSFPGYSSGDFAFMWLEAEYDSDVNNFNKRSYIREWNGEVIVSLYITYRKSGVWYCQGYMLPLKPNDPFNIPRNAFYIGGTYQGLSASSEAGLANLMKRQHIFPDESNFGSDVSYYSNASGTTITVNEIKSGFTLSGTFDPTRQYFKSGTTASAIMKAMLVMNMAVMKADTYPWPGDTATAFTRIRSIINPTVQLNSEETEPSKYFLQSEITHHKKSGLAYSDQMFSALSVLVDADFKQVLMPSIYQSLLAQFRYTYTFAAHNTVAGVTSLAIGDLIWTPQTNGNAIITAISDQDDNGLITFTAVGGY